MKSTHDALIDKGIFDESRFIKHITESCFEGEARNKWILSKTKPSNWDDFTKWYDDVFNLDKIWKLCRDKVINWKIPAGISKLDD